MTAPAANDGGGRPQDRLGGKAALHRKRPKRYRENLDVAAGVMRQIQKLGERVAVSDPEELELLLAIVQKANAALRTAVEGQRASGHTDGAIGEVLGTTRQAVEQRWPRTSTNEKETA